MVFYYEKLSRLSFNFYQIFISKKLDLDFYTEVLRALKLFIHCILPKLLDRLPDKFLLCYLFLLLLTRHLRTILLQIILPLGIYL